MSKVGRHPLPKHLRKEPISLKLPLWLIDKLTAEPESRAVLIETALREKHGWAPDN